MAKLTYDDAREKINPNRHVVQENYNKAVASIAKLLFAAVKQAVVKTVGKPIDKQQTKTLYHSLILPIFAIDKQDIGSIYDVLTNWKTILDKLVSLVESNHSRPKSYFAMINPAQKLTFSPENLPTIESGVKAFYGTIPKSMSVPLSLFINPFHGCLDQPNPILVIITEYLDQEYAIYKAGQIKKLLQRATRLDSKYNYYKILILNVFEKNDLLCHQDQQKVRETIKLANALYTNIGYEGKLAYACKLIEKPSSDSGGSICKLGITSYKTLELAVYLNWLLSYIKVYASKGEWNSPNGKAVRGYTDQIFLREELEPFCRNKSKDEKDAVLKEALGLCFEAINEGILSKKHPDTSCSILFAKQNKQLMEEILVPHPEYLVSPFITKSINRSIKKDWFDTLQSYTDTLQSSILEKTPKDTEFFQFVDDVPTLCPFDNGDIDDVQVRERLTNTQSKLREMSAKIRDDEYILKMMPPEFSTINYAANIMRLIIKKFLSKLIIDLGRGEGDCASIGILVALEDLFTESIIGANDNEEGLVFD